MTATTTWRGRRGTVLLGPTEDRVARYLADATRRGRVTIRHTEIAERLGISRKDLYRITARLRMLGLFGIENDRGGTNRGRRYWRTAIEHDGTRLDPVKHRVAWSRILAWSRARKSAIDDALAGIRNQPRQAAGLDGAGDLTRPAVVPRPDAAGRTFRDLFAAAGGSTLLAVWGVE
jgi:DNA-binding transcriptional regulator LsrR (DeoR family)